MELVIAAQSRIAQQYLNVSSGIVRLYYAPLTRTASALFSPGECLVQPRLATIRRIAMNDPALGRFVDRRNDCANFIAIRRWRGAYLLLQSSQVRLNAFITTRSAQSLPGAFSG